MFIYLQKTNKGSKVPLPYFRRRGEVTDSDDPQNFAKKMKAHGLDAFLSPGDLGEEVSILVVEAAKIKMLVED